MRSLQSTPCEDSQEVEANGDQFEPAQQPAGIGIQCKLKYIKPIKT